MAVSSLRYRPGGSSSVTVSQNGYVAYDGTPEEYHYWYFRTRLKLDAIPVIQDGDSAETIAKVVAIRREVLGQIIEDLKGEALSVAMEIGISRLFGDDGGDTLMTNMLDHVFPVARHSQENGAVKGTIPETGYSSDSQENRCHRIYCVGNAGGE